MPRAGRRAWRRSPRAGHSTCTTVCGRWRGRLIEARGRLADVDAGAVLRRGEELRLTSYRRRVSPEMEGARCLTGAVIQDVAAGAERAVVLGSIDKHSVRTEGNEPRLWRLPDGMTAPAFLGHLVHRGALQRGEDGLFRCPIPSFRDYLVEQGGGQVCGLKDTARPEENTFEP